MLWISRDLHDFFTKANTDYAIGGGLVFIEEMTIDEMLQNLPLHYFTLKPFREEQVMNRIKKDFCLHHPPLR
jgi:hypothetical protein